MAGYGEWTKTAHVRDLIESLRPLAITMGERRHAGATRMSQKTSNQHQGEMALGDQVKKGQRLGGLHTCYTTSEKRKRLETLEYNA